MPFRKQNKTASFFRISWRQKTLAICFIIATLGLLLVSPSTAKPMAQSSGSDVIAAVNALRAEHGLPLLNINQSLMSAAQAHSEYQAKTGKLTHTGVDFSSPKSRAIAAGFGSGAVVFIFENIASGVKLTPEQAVELWQSDSAHLSAMLSAYITDAGAGVASDGDTIYITLDTGYVAGQAGHGPGQSIATLPAGSPTQTPGGSSGGFTVRAVATVTPKPDGSIIHIVQPGEVLSNIAEAYKVKLSDLYKLNYMNDQSVIFPGQKIKIKAPDPTRTPTQTPTQTNIPTATRRPTRTPTPTPFLTPTSATTLTPTLSAQPARSGPDYLLIAIGVLVALGIGLVLTGSILKRR